MEGSVSLEDMFENEFSWLFLVGNRPNEITVVIIAVKILDNTV